MECYRFPYKYGDFEGEREGINFHDLTEGKLEQLFSVRGQKVVKLKVNNLIFSLGMRKDIKLML